MGICLFFTGLSGAGKSTIAEAFQEHIKSMYKRPVTLLDGDLVREHLSSELSFSKEDRDTNIKRIGFVASEIVKHNGIVLCAAIAPYEAARLEVEKMVSSYGTFILVHVSTPLAVCEGRDVKGMYAKARRGIIREFTGISDPYEEPKYPTIELDTSKIAVHGCVNILLKSVSDFL